MIIPIWHRKKPKLRKVTYGAQYHTVCSTELICKKL